MSPAPTCSSCASSAARRSARTSPSALTAAHRLRSRAPKLPRVKSREPWPAAPGAPGAGAGLARGRRAGAERRRTRTSRRAYARRRRRHTRRSRWSRSAARVGAHARRLSGLDPHRGPRLGLGEYVSFFKIAIGGPLHGDWWKLLTSPFAYVNGLYAFVALLATAIFGWLLERRHGPAIVLAVFFGGGHHRRARGERGLRGADRQRRKRRARWR